MTDLTARQIDALTQAQSDMLDEQEHEEALAALRVNPDDAEAKSVVEKYRRRGLIVRRVARAREVVGNWRKIDGRSLLYVTGAAEGDVVPIRNLRKGQIQCHKLGKKVASCLYESAGVDLLATAERIARERERRGK